MTTPLTPEQQAIARTLHLESPDGSWHIKGTQLHIRLDFGDALSSQMRYTLPTPGAWRECYRDMVEMARESDGNPTDLDLLQTLKTARDAWRGAVFFGRGAPSAREQATVKTFAFGFYT